MVWIAFSKRHHFLFSKQKIVYDARKKIGFSVPLLLTKTTYYGLLGNNLSKDDTSPYYLKINFGVSIVETLDSKLVLWNTKHKHKGIIYSG